eukprot:12318187-Karenia_brevis.AAC.1
MGRDGGCGCGSGAEWRASAHAAAREQLLAAPTARSAAAIAAHSPHADAAQDCPVDVQSSA